MLTIYFVPRIHLNWNNFAYYTHWLETLVKCVQSVSAPLSWFFESREKIQSRKNLCVTKVQHVDRSCTAVALALIFKRYNQFMYLLIIWCVGIVQILDVNEVYIDECMQKRIPSDFTIWIPSYQYSVVFTLDLLHRHLFSHRFRGKFIGQYKTDKLPLRLRANDLSSPEINK